jgi:hypothetical protein
MESDLQTLQITIAKHAAQLADKEWHNEHRPILFRSPCRGENIGMQLINFACCSRN